MMSIRDFDFKQFFIEKGERVGLGITAVLMVVITVVSLFMPNHGFLVPRPSDNAKALTDVADSVVQRQDRATPGEADKPPPIPAVPVSFDTGKIEDTKPYEVAHIFLAPPAGSTKRRMPREYQCDEGTAVVAESQIRSYIFSPKNDNPYGNIMVLEGGGAAAAPADATAPGAAGRGRNAPGGFVTNLQRGIGLGGGRPAEPGAAPGVTQQPRPTGIGQFGGQRATALLRPGQVAAGTADGRSAMRSHFVDVDSITDTTTVRFAEDVLPLRQAIICASFPYRKQVEEFQRKLHLPSPLDVLDEQSEETDEDGSPTPTFHFLGVDVQRRVLGPDGKPLEKWKTLNLAEDMRPFIIKNGTRFEPDPKDPPEISSLIIDGLWMPLLQQFDEENKHASYPRVELQLTNILQTLQALKGKEAEQIQVASNPLTNKDNFNPFKREGARPAARPVAARNAPGAPATAGPTGIGNLAGGLGNLRQATAAQRSRAPRPGAGAQPQGADQNAPSDAVLPEHVLVRVVDVNIDPGKIYEYRLHVRMANPNYHRFADVLSPSYATEKELVAQKDLKDSDWYVIPKKVSVPPEFYYYAVDQKELDGAQAYHGLHAKTTPLRDQQTVFQIQRWLEDANREGTQPIYVGEWTVAERVIVSRGEYIGRTETVNVPVWKRDIAGFTLALPPTHTGAPRRREPGIDVDFSSPDYDAVLVDFEGGPQHFERKIRRDDRTENLKLDERISTEVLVVSSDGRVAARNSAYDAYDQERVDRLRTWRERVMEVRLASTPAAAPGSPFGQMNPGAARPPGAAGAPGIGPSGPGGRGAVRGAGGVN